MRYLLETFEKLTGRRTSYDHHDSLESVLYSFNNGNFDDEIVTISQLIPGFWTPLFKTGVASDSQGVIIETKGIDVPPYKLMTFAIDESKNPIDCITAVYLRQFRA